MKRITIIGFMILLAFLQGCEKYEMIDYGEGGEINFMWVALMADGEYRWNDDEKDLTWTGNFGLNPLGDSLHVDTILVGVKIMGVKTSRPRKVVLKSNVPEERALEVIFPEDYYVPADSAVAYFKVLVKRPPTRDEMYTTTLVFDYAQSDFEAGTEERQVFKLEAEDRVSMELWDMTEEDWEYEAEEYFGAYSETKMRYVITRLGCADFWEWYWSADSFWELLDENTLYESLKEYRSDPSNPPLLDENTGEWIEFPDLFDE